MEIPNPNSRRPALEKRFPVIAQESVQSAQIPVRIPINVTAFKVQSAAKTERRDAAFSIFSFERDSLVPGRQP